MKWEGGRERLLLWAVQEVQSLITWFVGVGQMGEGCRLSKTVFGGGKMCGKRRDKRMF